MTVKYVPNVYFNNTHPFFVVEKSDFTGRFHVIGNYEGLEHHCYSFDKHKESICVCYQLCNRAEKEQKEKGLTFDLGKTKIPKNDYGGYIYVPYKTMPNEMPFIPQKIRI